MTQYNKNDNDFNDVNDDMISNAVQSVRFSLPQDLDRRVRAAMFEEERAALRKQKNWASPRKWLPATAAALLLVVGALFLFHPFGGGSGNQKNNAPISEIKTEVELAHANIKIIWVQKKDFTLKKL